jgi:hypothetical protein
MPLAVACPKASYGQDFRVFLDREIGWLIKSCRPFWGFPATNLSHLFEEVPARDY